MVSKIVRSWRDEMAGLSAGEPLHRRPSGPLLVTAIAVLGTLTARQVEGQPSCGQLTSEPTSSLDSFVGLAGSRARAPGSSPCSTGHARVVAWVACVSRPLSVRSGRNDPVGSFPLAPG